MTSERKKRARCALCDTTESPAGWFAWNNRPTVKFCAKCWKFGTEGVRPGILAFARRVCRV